ncbi:hypothetical protein DEO72_LG11g2500 [Vigna unguiculata]|uniref:Uncharacterized protein n=1 Tax=Vigna unguiculata TaxID=3917 RepID=A0A4D6NSL0_VIGUN|nr:hypothetical protein DEO72_LG11g2500 [Vigna unguiculata]
MEECGRVRVADPVTLAWTPAVAGIADDGLQQAGPCDHEGDQCSPCRERIGEAKEETLVQECFARGGVKGDGVAVEDFGEGR